MRTERTETSLKQDYLKEGALLAPPGLVRRETLVFPLANSHDVEIKDHRLKTLGREGIKGKKKGKIKV